MCVQYEILGVGLHSLPSPEKSYKDMANYYCFKAYEF